MSMVAAQPRFTPDDLLHLEDEGPYELVGGRLVEKAMSSLSSRTAGIITIEIGIFLRQNPVGELYPEQSFQCFPGNPDLIRRPDIAFISKDRAGGVAESEHVKISPDLAIEVVSPADTIYDLDAKLADYRSVGVKLVWVVDPKWKTVRIHRADRTVSELLAGDTLSGEQVLPGFSVIVENLIPEQPSTP